MVKKETDRLKRVTIIAGTLFIITCIVIILFRFSSPKCTKYEMEIVIGKHLQKQNGKKELPPYIIKFIGENPDSNQFFIDGFNLNYFDKPLITSSGIAPRSKPFSNQKGLKTGKRKNEIKEIDFKKINEDLPDPLFNNNIIDYENFWKKIDSLYKGVSPKHFLIYSSDSCYLNQKIKLFGDTLQVIKKPEILRHKKDSILKNNHDESLKIILIYNPPCKSEAPISSDSVPKNDPGPGPGPDIVQPKVDDKPLNIDYGGSTFTWKDRNDIQYHIKIVKQKDGISIFDDTVKANSIDITSIYPNIIKTDNYIVNVIAIGNPNKKGCLIFYVDPNNQICLKEKCQP